MVATETAATLGPMDAAAGLALSDEAGWNQTIEDWRYFLGAGRVLAARSPEGSVVATAALLPYGGTCWISLVLVTAAWRRQGLASRLVGACLALADENGWEAWLDATPAGAAVYEKLGFREAGRLTRVRRPAHSAAQPSEPHGAAATGRTAAALRALDRDALGLDRSGFLSQILARPGTTLYGDETACCAVRDGRRARQIGPVHARTALSAADLVNRVAAAEAGELVMDVHARDPAFGDALKRLGFATERPYVRMHRGPASSHGMQELAYASAGPEYG